jgi:ribosomal protein S18 acetylase RimI-like enzyme
MERMSETTGWVNLTTATAADVPAIVEPLFFEYGEWVAKNLKEEFGITYTDADLRLHHEAFRAELPGLLGPGGRLLVARLDHEPVGVGALRPVDETTAEIKRMYVRPTGQGRGIGRAILTGLVQHAIRKKYETVRLETLRFMTAARAMYRSYGFVETARFDGSEAADTVLDEFTIAMRLELWSEDR